MTLAVGLTTLAVHGLLDALTCFDDCTAGERAPLALLWLVPIGYGIIAFRRVGRRQDAPTTRSAWPWAVSTGLIAISVLVASCFAVVWL
jgi:hypothetical protein